MTVVATPGGKACRGGQLHHRAEQADGKRFGDYESLL